MAFLYRLIDLTHTLHADVPTWGGSCGFSHQICSDYPEGQFRALSLAMNAGIGTHIDTPNHIIPNGLAVHELKLDELCMPCVVIDVSSKIDASYKISADDIVAFENAHGKIQPRCCVMFKTGWERFWSQPQKYRNGLAFPTLSSKAADLVLKREAQALGIDTLSPDLPDTDFYVHKAILGAGKILIENVANLDKMPITGGFVLALPLKIRDATEAPVRMVGLVDKMKEF